MVIYEYQSTKTIKLIPILAEVLEVLKLLTIITPEYVSKVEAMLEFRDAADPGVLVSSDGLSEAHVNDLVINVLWL